VSCLDSLGLGIWYGLVLVSGALGCIVSCLSKAWMGGVVEEAFGWLDIVVDGS